LPRRAASSGLFVLTAGWRGKTTTVRRFATLLIGLRCSVALAARPAKRQALGDVVGSMPELHRLLGASPTDFVTNLTLSPLPVDVVIAVQHVGQ